MGKLSAIPSPELSNLPDWLHWLESCPSTNTWAIDHAVDLQHGDVVFTRQQTAGRGQHGRIWYSPSGVLTASFILDRLLPFQLSGLSLVAGLAVIDAVEDLVPDQQGGLRLKWANDVLVNERKLAGILCEATSGSNSSHTRVVVGIGLNRCVDLVEAGLTVDQIGRAISLQQIADLVPEELPLLEKLRHHLLQVSDSLSRTSNPSSGIADFLPKLRQRDVLLDRRITLALAGEQISGQAVGIDAWGRLLLQLPNQEIKAFASGRVAW
ncbi:biotin--[acetyl-CoA-carboxylase] ligase [Phormidium tenue FACHB-886]|nr:biotin--[acetyl-CoA-carboxylase] ligase [Phormidium tenue FACHB-886]